MKRKPLVLLVALAAAPALHGQVTGTWSATPADGNWSNAANWDSVPGATSGTANADSAIFNSSSVTTIVVDSGRNVRNITFGGASTFTLSGSTLLLSSGGKILSNGSAVDQRISAALQIQGGSGGTYTIETNTPGTNREIQLSGLITGTATAGGTTTLTLAGSSTGINEIMSTGGIGDGSAGGNLALVKEGGSLWVFGGNNSYSGGTTIKGGTLRLSGSGNTSTRIGAGTLTLDGAGATLRLQSTTATTVNNAVVVGPAGGTISNRTNNFFNPSSISGTGTLTLTGDTGLLMTTTDMKNFGGTVRVLGGTNFSLRLGTGFVDNSLQNAVVQLESGTSLIRQNGTSNTITADIGTLSGVAGSTLGGSAAGSGTFVYRVGGRNENSEFAGVIANGGTATGLTKVGSGKLTLSNANTYTGATIVSAGTLLVTGSLGATNVTVGVDGTIGGNGNLAGDLLIEAGGSLDLTGATLGLTSTGILTVDSGKTITLNDFSFADIVGWNAASAADGIYTLINGGLDVILGGSTPTISSPFALSGSKYGYFQEGSLQAVIYTIPEPGAALLGGLGMLALLRRRNRR